MTFYMKRVILGIQKRKEVRDMSEKMLVTQALDERDLLVKKILDKIEKASFVDIIKRNEEQVYNHRMLKKDYKKQCASLYQQIIDYISYYQKLDNAIVVSNATHYIETSYGKMTVAAAISLRNRLKGNSIYDDDGDFETVLYKKMKSEYEQQVEMMEEKNRQLYSTAETMRLSILGKDTKVRDDKPLAIVEEYVKENTVELVDSISILEKMDYLHEKKNTLLRELDTQIKVSNATTFIEI